MQNPLSLFGNTNHVSDVGPAVAVYFYFCFALFAIFTQLLVFKFNSIVLLVSKAQFRKCCPSNRPDNASYMLILYRHPALVRELRCATSSTTSLATSTKRSASPA